jgi:hypothetical protein
MKIKLNFMIKKHIFLMVVTLLCLQYPGQGQPAGEGMMLISGNLLTDQRLRLSEGNDWIWNENRLSLKLDNRPSDRTRFYSEVWMRNMGLPNAVRSADLYNKGILDPFQMEIREAWVRFSGFLSPNLDLTLGRQRLAWGTADRFNPTNNLAPADLEDLLDFGRQRGTDALNLQWYMGNDFSLQGVIVPFFRPANLPVGVMAGLFQPQADLSMGEVSMQLSDTLLMPRNNLKESLTAGARFRGFVSGVDFSLSYIWGYDGLPFNTRNTIALNESTGALRVDSELSFLRTHIAGVDLSTSILGVGLWAEAAIHFPHKDLVMTMDLRALGLPVQENVILSASKPYVKFVAGGDYHFVDGSYLNIQYLRGFIHERGGDELNDYVFMRFEKKLLNDKLTVAPLNGGFAVMDWSAVRDNSALVYMPEITWSINPNTDLGISSVIIHGKGDSMFARLKELDMLVFKMSYSFEL